MAAAVMTQGTLHYGDRTQSIIRDVWPDLFMVKPTNFPVFTVASQNASSLSTTQVMFEMMQDQYLTQRIVLDANDAYAGSSPTTTYTPSLNVGTVPGDISWFQVGARWINFDKGPQTLKVTAVDTVAGTVTLATEDGSNVTAGAAGNRFDFQDFPLAQGGLIQTAIASKPTFPYNYAQLFSVPFGVDTSLDVTKMYTGPEFQRQQDKSLYEMKKQIEYACIYGQRGTFTDGEGLTGYKTGGWNEIIATHRDTFTSGGLTWALWNTFLANHAFATGTTQKICYTNRKGYAALETIAQGSFRWISDLQSFGLNIHRWQSGYGNLDIVVTDSIRETKEVFYFIEAEYWKLRLLQPTFLKTNTQEPNRLAKGAAYITEVGAQLGNEPCHAKYSAT
jgi:hypothetical protein